MQFDPSCIDVEDYLDCLEMRNVARATDDEFRFSCPYPDHVKGDETPSAYMNVETTAFFCHSCHASGNAITFAADVLGVSPIVAIRMLKQRYSPGGLDPDSRDMVEEIRKILNKPEPEKRVNHILHESVLDSYRDMPNDAIRYIRGRGFSDETILDWQFGYSFLYNRITLPVRDENGNLVGIKARAIDKHTKPKYKNLMDKSNGVWPFLKNEVVFALDRVLNWSGYDGAMIIVEGELNAVAMHAMGYKNTVAINGSYFGERQIRLIREHAERAVLFFDSDKAGFSATNAVARALLPSLFVDVCPEHAGDPADMHPYSVRRCLAERMGYMEVMLRS